MTWEGAHFWGRALRAAEDGALGVESRSPGGTQIMTFLGGSGGECFPPGRHGNFTGWQDSGDEEQEAGVISHSQIRTRTHGLRTEGWNQARGTLLSSRQIDDDAGSLMRLRQP